MFAWRITPSLLALCVLLSCIVVGCAPTANEPNLAEVTHDRRGDRQSVIATFSIVAVDPESGVCGAAVASKYPAVGEVVPYVRGGVGAFCTQHYHNPDFGPRTLEMLAEGKPPSEILFELTRDDPRADTRQLAIIDHRGRTAQLNPIAAPERSLWWGGMSGRFYACQGNTLVGRDVVTAMAAAYETTEGTLADRLMAALVAGDRKGGDHRGRLAAGIVVDKPEVDGDWLNLQVDKSDDAVRDLANKYVELEHEAKGEWENDQPPWQEMPVERETVPAEN
ncbi:MAG: DUF1028 domain-containing protein [Planctomycetota bacterium]|nr:MAG: DUF1028 domain-containing protein [Planctomycetota bacterium]